MSNPRTPRDPHQILGLAPGATREQINAAYRHALRRLHPDTRPTTEPIPDVNRDTNRAERGLTTQLTADLTVTDLQHARRDLLRAEQQNRTPNNTTTPNNAVSNRAAPAVGMRAPAHNRVAPQTPVLRPDSPSSPGWPRGYHPGVGARDIICGPVRYHGPPARSC